MDINNFNIFLYTIFLGLLTSCGVTKKYEEAKYSKSIHAYEAYVSKYPKSKYFEQANKELAVLYEERDWESARSSNSIYGYKNFLSIYPYSKYARQAEQRIVDIEENNAWSKAKALNSIYAYENFISSYPSSKYVFDAKNNIAKIKDDEAWKEAELQGTVSAYNKYITNFPDGIRKSTALHRIREIEVIQPAWDKAKKTNSPESYRSFLHSYPNSFYSQEAKQKLTELEFSYWNKAKKNNSINSYQEYLSNFPDGNYSSEAEKKIIDLEVDAIFKGEHGVLPPMSKTSYDYTYTLTNDIEIYNNTKYILTVRYCGVESMKIVLSPKQKKTINLKNGDYRVTASVNATNVTNYAGKEKLEGGSYSSEFYIETKTYWEK